MSALLEVRRLFHSFHWHMQNAMIPCSSQELLPFLSVMYHITSFIPLACAECNDSLPFSGASSIPLCYILLGEGHSKIRPRADDAPEAVAKASRIRE